MPEIVYLDHAATSWPKPREVTEAVMDALVHAGVNAGRGTHGMAVGSGRILVKARAELAKLFHVRNAQDIAFTYNTTMSLNMAIRGTLKPGDHVIATMAEHNSVRRPLEYLRRTIGVEIDYMVVNPEGMIDLKAMQNAFKANTKLVICNHSSNLLGSILPIGEIGELVRGRGAVFLVDAAQSAGVLPIDVETMNIDLLAFPGHKSLLGPQGTGGLYISPRLELEPLLLGGTGSQSESGEQPTVRPDRYEAGTVNTPGIAGLGAGVKLIRKTGTEAIYRHEWELTQRLMEGLAGISGIRLLGPGIGKPRSGIAAFTVEGMDSAAVAHALDRRHHIAVRSGLHCTPLAHQSVQTLHSGAVRASVGMNTGEEEIDLLVTAMKELCSST